MPKMTATAGPATIKPGTYPATFAALEEFVTGEGAELYRWHFRITPDHEDPITLSGISSRAFGPRAKARRWAAALTGRTLEAGEVFDPSDHAGSRCVVMVSIERKDGVDYNRLDDVLPIVGQPQADEDIPF